MSSAHSASLPRARAWAFAARACAVSAALALALPAAALVVASPDEARHESAPRRNPGWAHVGQRGSLSGIHIRDGWVLTASHVGGGELLLDGTTYPLVPDSWQQLQNPDGSDTRADLGLFRVQPAPDLPELPLREAPLLPNTRVVLVGYGQRRGDGFEWNGVPGFRWRGPGLKRWGANRVRQVGLDVRIGPLRTHCFDMAFSGPGSGHDTQAAVGDSGGAVLARHGGRWELAGVMIAISTFPGQPPSTSLYGNTTTAADVSYYRSQILAVMEGRVPRPPGGGGPGRPSRPKLP